MTPTTFDPNDHGFLPTLTPTTTRLMTVLQIQQDAQWEDQHTLALVADHVVTTAELLRGPVLHLTRATLAFELDPQTSLVTLTAQLLGVQDAPAAGVEARHLARLLFQDDFIRTGNDYALRRNVYAVAYRALLTSQDGYDPDQALAGFDDAIELAETALRYPAAGPGTPQN